MITKEMNIMEIVEKKPKAAEVMAEYGLHCFGCMAGQFESLGQGAEAHGMNKKQIEEMLKKINESKEE